MRLVEKVKKTNEELNEFAHVASDQFENAPEGNQDSG